MVALSLHWFHFQVSGTGNVSMGTHMFIVSSVLKKERSGCRLQSPNHGESVGPSRSERLRSQDYDKDQYPSEKVREEEGLRTEGRPPGLHANGMGNRCGNWVQNGQYWARIILDRAFPRAVTQGSKFKLWLREWLGNPGKLCLGITITILWHYWSSLEMQIGDVLMNAFIKGVREKGLEVAGYQASINLTFRILTSIFILAGWEHIQHWPLYSWAEQQRTLLW